MVVGVGCREFGLVEVVCSFIFCGVFGVVVVVVVV